MSPEKFEPRVANVDLLSVVVNAEMMVDHKTYTDDILKKNKTNALSLSIDS